jgi:ferredoxin
MKTVCLEPLDKTPEVHTEEPILEALLAEQLDVMMACGGRGRCATCHVYVEEGMQQLSDVENRERRTLGRLSHREGNSRLACQAEVQGEGVVVRVPEGMYPEDLQDVEDLIGRRATSDIRHPEDGRILIEEGKIITRSRIRELEDVEFAITEEETDDAL